VSYGPENMTPEMHLCL